MLYELYKQEVGKSMYSPSTNNTIEEKQPFLFETSGHLNRGSALYDSYELKSIVRELDQALGHAPPPPPSKACPEEKCLSTPTPMHLQLEAQTPAWKMSPSNRGSMFYDSFEHNAVTQLLGRAVHTTQTNISAAPTPPHSQLLAVTNMSNSRTWNGDRTLYDSYELDTIAQEINQALHHPSPEESSGVKYPSRNHLQLQARRKPVWKLSPVNGGSKLYDSYELKRTTQDLDQALYLPPPQVNSRGKRPSMSPTMLLPRLQVRSPLWRLSPSNRSSTLYDAHDLKAAVQQLNRVMQTTQKNASPFSHQLLSSTFHPSGRDLACLRKEKALTPKRVTCPPVSGGPIDAKTSNKSILGTVLRLWKKLKRTFLRIKQK